MIYTGWLKDKLDSRDYLHKYGAVPAPNSYSNYDLLTSIRNQGNCSSCVGHGLGMTANGVKKLLGIFVEWASPTWIYNGARYIEGTLHLDCGCYPRDALDWMVKYGILLEQYWIYEGFDATPPSSARMKQADKYVGFQYFRCVDGIDGICDAIAQRNLVGLGSPWFKEWETAPCGQLATPTKFSLMAGGHETCLYAYDKAQGMFYGANSWGTGWGDKGLYKMPFESIDAFKYKGGYDANYITFTADKVINPEPVKDCVLSEWLRKIFSGGGS